MTKKLITLAILVLLLGVLSACSPLADSRSGYYLVDPLFSDLYERLHGEEVLGPPLSSLKYLAGSNQEKQYFEGVVMVFDPDSSPRYYLEPVGLDAGFSDLPNNSPDNPAVRYLNGFIIPPEFSQFYDQMGGERWVGLPLTRARLNPEKNRVEQYFENMGFFRFEDDPPGLVHLMPYGLWKCAGECSQYPGLENAAISTSKREVVESPFGEAIARFGTRFTGQTVTDAYRASDGSVEQIFQNVVLYEDHSSPLGVSLRPISSQLGQGSDQLQTREEKGEGYFREVQDGAGYYIPSYFMEYIDRYFGFEVSGNPISRVEEIRPGVSQQCFENYCLMYDAKADPDQQVRIVPQGQKYKDAYYADAQAPQSEPAAVERQIQLDIWEQLPQISSRENQQIGACIHDAGMPLVNARVEVRVTPEDGETSVYQGDSTDSGGCSFLQVGPVEAANGTTVDYEVCFLEVGDRDYCKKDSYLIWGNTEDQLESGEELAQPASQSIPDDLTLDVWELHPQLSSADSQEIGACAHWEGEPQANLEAQLLLEDPQQGVVSYSSAPTDAGGCTFFKLDPVDAKNGETIPYQVCFINKYGEKTCQRDSFLIWGNP